MGGEAASACRLLVHDPAHDVVTVGRTSFGTPVINREVVASDLLVGIGGVYPQYTAGFGGGSKLAIGVLGLPSIVKLHYGHPRVEGSYDVDNEFRRDLDEIARMIGLQTVISVHVDAAREIVRVVSGDHFSYYREAARFSADTYSVPAPGNADVVISNSYPADVSLTFVRSKGMIPLFQASARASRVVLAACSEGAGHHQLFPFTASRFQRQIHLGRAAVARPGDIPAKVARRLRTSLERLDGSGYPRGLSGDAITPAGRVLGAADAYHAMIELRPHREAHSPDEAANRLRAEAVAGRLDGDAANAVLRAAGHPVKQRRPWPASLTAREVEVLRLVACGYSNQEISDRFVISRKTPATTSSTSTRRSALRTGRGRACSRCSTG